MKDNWVWVVNQLIFYFFLLVPQLEQKSAPNSNICLRIPVDQCRAYVGASIEIVWLEICECPVYSLVSCNKCLVNTSAQPELNDSKVCFPAKRILLNETRVSFLCTYYLQNNVARTVAASYKIIISGKKFII